MDAVRSTRRIIDVVRGLTPDIVAFQEIHERLRPSGGEDQPDMLARGLNRSFVFQRLLRFGRGGYGVGLAVLGTVLERKEHLLPSVKEQRGALELRLRVSDGQRLTVFCTHWGLDAEERLRQAEALVEWVNAAPRPTVVCGDLNEGPEGEGVQRLLRETGLTDADSGQGRLTFPSDHPTARIDFVLFSPELKVQRVEVIDTPASDHLPVLVDFAR
jgi:endonuclease/exonuclease/phosphatase family metal-dependent hydrolase